MRRSIIAGNWKMYKTHAEARELALALRELLVGVDDREIVIAPPATALSTVAEVIRGSNIQLAAQNMHWEPEGAFTGEVSPVMLKALDCRYVIIGHSERRAYFGETDAMVNRKIKSALAHGLKPILCVGESLRQREARLTLDVIGAQLEGGLHNLSAEQVIQIVVAYEPIWAIGTGKTATPAQANEVQAFIREKLGQMFSFQVAETVRIQYGGSVKPDNIDGLMEQPHIDGVLVGGASLSAESFARIVKYKTV